MVSFLCYYMQQMYWWSIPSAEITLPMTRGIGGSQVTLCGEWLMIAQKWWRLHSYGGLLHSFSYYEEKSLQNNSWYLVRSNMERDEYWRPATIYYFRFCGYTTDVFQLIHQFVCANIALINMSSHFVDTLSVATLNIVFHIVWSNASYIIYKWFYMQKS